MITLHTGSRRYAKYAPVSLVTFTIFVPAQALSKRRRRHAWATLYRLAGFLVNNCIENENSGPQRAAVYYQPSPQTL